MAQIGKVSIGQLEGGRRRKEVNKVCAQIAICLAKVYRVLL